MCKRKTPVSARRDPTDEAIGLFGILAVAVDEGDYATAAKVQRTLARLGWIVSRRTA